MSTTQYIIAIVGGFLAGVVNTLAGSGSVITLGFLTEILGLPANLANGTNRVGVFMQSLASAGAFKQNNKLPLERSKLIIIMTIIGAIFGVWTAVLTPNESFKVIYKYLMILMLGVILIKPQRWLQAADLEKKLPLWISIPAFLLIGFYGGFIQMGVGVFFLAVMVLVAKYDLVESNAVKTVVITIYTAIVLVIFHFQGLVDWKIGGIIAIGQATGGYLTAQFASKSDQAAIWAYRLLVVIVILVVLNTFGAFNAFIS
jgi:uncharacterized membrane protein YfcA